ncbi:tetratricopeptide repeat protein [Ichthyenterobacterium magnum]|uniref:Tetratricopeptide repeat protein n=1 Tax=Ichthyenterobacterium magnum TaxID=1230530 RepID=A0A420DWQ7_9FLAO|nr:tetratricopeptide repeat protein [Ichthyenterobacterium magnum]RKE98656.1 tetratricopeptide repeat protein [Ichthyenterobacterium magnum]
MKKLILLIIALNTLFSFSQNEKEEKERLLVIKKANDLVHEGNELISEDDYISAEMEYRKAMSEQPTSVSAAFNLGNSYYKKGNYEEALFRHEQAAKNATSKAEKHKAYHNIGNVLMQNKMCKEAVEAYKNALRNDPTDDESRYNLALAKDCADQQGGGEDENKDDKKEDEDKKDEGDNEDDKKDEGNQDDKDKKEGDDEKDEDGKPKDDKKQDGKGDDKEKEQQKPQPKQGQLSPQQIKNLLEAMNNQEQKVQEKINAEKQKGVKVKTEKDW